MTIQGLRNAQNFEAVDALKIRPQNWREGILLREPNGKAPLFALTAAMKSKSLDDPTYHWFEKVMESRRAALTANPSTTDPGTFTAATNAFFNAGIRIGHLVRIEQTGEIVRVTTAPALGGTTFVATRGIGALGGGPGIGATAVAYATAGVNPFVHVIGTALGEGSLPPTAFAFDPVERFNHTQIFRATLSMTRTAQKTRLRTGDSVKEAKRETLLYHSADIEWSMWFGQRAVTTDPGNGSNPMRLMDGVLAQISNHGSGSQVVDNAGATVTLVKLEDWMERAFRQGSSEKMAFCGNEAMLSIQRAVRKNSAYQFMQGQKEFGMNVSRLTSPFGDLVIKTHPLFNQIPSSTNPGGGGAYWSLSTWCAILDMSDLEYKYLSDSDTQYQPKLQDNGLDGLLSGYLTECSVAATTCGDHLLIKGLGAGAAD